jgi:CMP-2-keto-3-deoxyoctulosonic acid synthetase
MNETICALAIIPAKTDSKRVKRKNLRVIDGKTLVEHAIEYAKNAELVKYIIVTTESEDVKEIAEKYDNVLVYSRDDLYMGEREVADVYINVLQKDLKSYGDEHIALDITHVVGVQPDHPDRTTLLDDLLTYAVDNKYDDLFTVDAQGTRNGAVRITKKEFVLSGTMSRRVGSFLDNCTNIHSEQDILDAGYNIERMNQNSDFFNE